MFFACGLRPLQRPLVAQECHPSPSTASCGDQVVFKSQGGGLAHLIGSLRQGGIDLSCAKQRTHPWPRTGCGAFLVKTKVVLVCIQSTLHSILRTESRASFPLWKPYNTVDTDLPNTRAVRLGHCDIWPLVMLLARMRKSSGPVNL